jgi:RNA polymerase sigma factor (sigma-70 family)
VEKQLDFLAKNYADTKDESVFRELHQLVEKLVYSTARKHEVGSGIPLEDFVSMYTEAVWEAARNYDGRTHFLQKLYTEMKQKRSKLYRHYRSQSRYSEDNALLYLDHGFDDEQRSLGERLPDERSNVEERVIGEESTKKMLAGFATSNERFGQVVQLLQFGCTNSEIAIALGANEYDAKTRKVVQRAKDAFRSFVRQHGTTGA